MAKIEKFEDIVAWQMGRTIANAVYDLTKGAPVSRDYGFVDQIRRSAVSIMNNVTEGYERGSNKDFAKFLYIARGSAGEVRSLLYVARDQKYIIEEQFDEISGFTNARLTKDKSSKSAYLSQNIHQYC